MLLFTFGCSSMKKEETIVQKDNKVLNNVNKEETKEVITKPEEEKNDEKRDNIQNSGTTTTVKNNDVKKEESKSKTENKKQAVNNSENKTTTKQEEEKPTPKEKPIWEQLGMSEYDYYNKPAQKFKTVNFKLEDYHNSIDEAMAACNSAGLKIKQENPSGATFLCEPVKSIPGKLLGVWIYWEKTTDKSN